jgi:RNA polymerase sporulation-specific sigma factor
VKTFLAPLSPEEEAACLTRMKNGDRMAKDELILHNMRLVAHVAKRYANSEEDSEDLISIGTIGLIKAVSTFNQNYGSRFATYAIRCIDNEMLMHFRSKKKTKGEVSMFEPIGTDKEGNQIHLFDILECEDVDVAEEMEKQQQMNRLKEHMKQLLTPREYDIIVRRYGLFGEKELTQREIAVTLGISRSYVSRIEKKALDKLKKFLDH